MAICMSKVVVGSWGAGMWLHYTNWRYGAFDFDVEVVARIVNL
jgi:hypothetical protein